MRRNGQRRWVDRMLEPQEMGAEVVVVVGEGRWDSWVGQWWGGGEVTGEV